MLLDATGVLLGVGLAVAGFVVIVVVSATVLRLIGFVLGDGEPDPAAGPPGNDAGDDPGNAPDQAGDQPSTEGDTEPFAGDA